MTLIEVLVALTIFATASLSLMKAVTQHTNTIAYLQEKTFAAMVVDNQMALALLENRAGTKSSGKTEMAGQVWYWTLTPIKTLGGYVQGFDISVSTNKEGSDPIVTVRSYAPK
jgi:general secretion pathway protein I